MNFKSFLVVALCLMFVWGSLLTFWWFKADEITKDPCRVCSERYGKTVQCSLIGSLVPVSKYFYPNGSVYVERPFIVSTEEERGFNWSEVLTNVTTG